MKNKLGLMVAAIVVAGLAQVGLAQSWDNYDFSKGNLENWNVLENEDDNIIIVRDFNVDGGFYYSTKNKKKHAEIASKKFVISEKSSIVSISFYKSGDTDCNVILLDNNKELEILCSTQNAPIDNFETREYDLSSYVGRTLYVLIKGGSANLNFVKLENRTGYFRSSLTAGTGDTSRPTALSTDQKTIYIVSDDMIRAYDLDTKEKEWHFSMPKREESNITHEAFNKQLIIGNNRYIYVTDNRGRIYALDDQGKYLWNFQTGATYMRIALGRDGTIFAAAELYVDTIYALDGISGEKKWEYITRDHPHGVLAVSEKIQTLFAGGHVPYDEDNSLMGRRDGRIRALNVNSGHKLWEYTETNASGFSVSAIGFDNTVYFNRQSNGGGTVAMNGETGEKLWSVSMGGSLISSDGNLLFFSNGTTINGKTGEEIWKNNEATGKRIVLNNGSILSIKNGSISCFSQLTGIRHWEHVVDKSIKFSLPVITNDGTVYFLGSDKTIHSIHTNSSGELVSPWPMIGQNSQRTYRQPLYEDQQRALASPVINRGELIDIKINYPGKDYTIPPKVNIIGGGGNGALAKAFVSDGIVSDIIILNSGQGYSSVPSIEIDWPPFPPKQAFATPQITNGFLTGFNIEDPGSGYQNVPAVRIINENGSGAIAEAVLDKSKVVEIKVINPGSGYDSDAIVVIDPPPYPPSRASGEATVVNGFVISLTVTNEGRSYSSPPSVEIIGEGGSGAEAIAILEDGLVVSLTLLGAGSGYPNDTEVIIAPPEGFEQSFEIEELFIRPAVELEFLTLESKIYQLQWSTDLNNWNDDEHPFGGIGGLTSIFKSAGADRVYWRLKVSD